MARIWFKPCKKATAFLLALAMVASPVSDYSALSTVKAAEESTLETTSEEVSSDTESETSKETESETESETASETTSEDVSSETASQDDAAEAAAYSEAAAQSVTASAAATIADIKVIEAKGYEEGAYVTWSPVEGADGYQAFVSSDKSTWTQLDDELIRKYPDYFRVDALGLGVTVTDKTKGATATYYVKIVAAQFDSTGKIVNDDLKKEVVREVTVSSHDRSGFAWTEGTSSGAYNEDGSLNDKAQVIYVTEATKDTVSLTVTGATTNPCVGLQNILYGYKKGKETRPLDVRIIGNVTDLKVMEDGDIIVDSNKGAAVTIEGVGEDAVANGWGIRIKNASDVEIRNLAFMNCDSKEGDNIGLQQGNDHIWVHNCDFFYGQAGSDADQVKGDGMLDCKKSNYVTFSYNHFWDSGKSSLLGLKEGSNDLYVTYHHNWFDHSDSRHPRVRFFTTHVYNNYYDGNAKYGIGGAKGGASIFSENNYFNYCKFPMLISMQGSDVWNGTGNDYANWPTFSKEDGSIIKAYGNIMVGETRFIPYASTDDLSTAWDESVDFDAYVASSRDEKVPTSVTSYKGGFTYNNFDTDTSNYVGKGDYKLDDAADVPTIVKTHAGRVNGGDFEFTFAADEYASSEVNAELKAAVTGYTSQLISVGGIQGASVKVEYTVTFDPGNGDASSEVKVEANHAVEKPDDPTTIPAGKVVFDGWYNGDTKWNFSKKVTGNMTLTGKWLAEGDMPGAEPSDEPSDTPSEDAGGSGGTPIGEDKVIHDFTQSGTTSQYFDISGNIKKSAGTSGTYNGTSYTGNALKMESQTEIDFTTTTESAKVVLLLPSTSTNSIMVDDVAYAAVAGVVTVESVAFGEHTISKKNSDNLFAIIVEPSGSAITEYTITVDKANGTENATFTVAIGGSIPSTQAELTYPTKDGYSFVGWQDGDGNDLEFPYKPKGNMTIKAVWQQDPGDEVGTVSDSEVKDMTLLASDITAGDYTAAVEKNGFTVTASSDKSVTVGSSSLTINKKKYTATLKSGGAGAMDFRSIKFDAKANANLYIACASGSSDSRPVQVAWLDESGAEAKLEVYTGAYKLNGTETTTVDSVAGSADALEKLDGKMMVTSSGAYISLTLPKDGTWYVYSGYKGINFYEVSVTYESYTVTFNSMGGDLVASQKVTPGAACKAPTAPSRYGYTLEGWYTDRSCTKAYDFTKAVKSDLTLFAKWTKNSGSQQNPSGGDEGGGSVVDSSDGLQVTLANPGETYTYTGSAITPAIIVTNNGEKLTAGVDYTVKYTNNVKVSTDKSKAKITVTGKGNLSGNQTQEFTIQPKNIADADVTVGDIVVASGSKAVPVLVYGSQKLTANKDFTFTDSAKKYTEKGTITITGKGNYTGEIKDVSVTVVEKGKLQKFVVDVDTTKTLEYNGSEQKPTVKVYDSADKSKTTPLTEDKDYVVVYPADCTSSGTVKITVVGMGSYTGTIVKTYKINPVKADKSGVVIADLDESVAKNGKSYTSSGVTIGDDLTVKYYPGLKSAEEIQSGSTALTLTEGKDYKITYTGNKKAGTAKYKVNFLGNYKGTAAISGQFEVNRVTLSDKTEGLEITVPDKVYKKAGIYKSAPYVTINGVALKSSDYTVTYYLDEKLETEMKGKSTVSIPASDTSATVWVKIVGKGNYLSDDATAYAKASYQVRSQSGADTVDLSKARITIKDGQKKLTKTEYTGKEIEPTVVVEVKNGKKWDIVPEISEGSTTANYTVTYVNNVNKGKATVVVTGAGNYVGSKTATFSIVAKNVKNLTDLLKDLFKSK